MRRKRQIYRPVSIQNGRWNNGSNVRGGTRVLEPKPWQPRAFPFSRAATTVTQPRVPVTIMEAGSGQRSRAQDGDAAERL